jgi:hypothetical protein
MWSEDMIFAKTWSDVLARLEREHGEGARVCVFPYGALQYGGE